MTLWHLWLFGKAPIRFLQDLLGLGWDRAFESVALLGDTWGMLLVGGVCLWRWGRETAYAAFGLVLLVPLTKALINVFVQLDRPTGPGIKVYQQFETPSFPSGHVYQATAPWTWLARRGRVAWGTVGLLVMGVAVSRLYLAAHYLGDVLAGVVLGVALALLYPWLWARARPWLQRRSFRFYLALGALALAGMAVNLYLNQENAHRWAVAGYFAGAVVGMLAEHHGVRYMPSEDARTTWLGVVLPGLVGLVGCYLLYHRYGHEAPLLGLAINALAALWVLLGVPAWGRYVVGRPNA